MKNGTLPTRIMHDLRRSNDKVVASGSLVGRYGSNSTVSRALRKLVEAQQLEPVDRGLYRVLPNEDARLAFDRAWSNPGADFDPDKRIAVTLARPTFRDVVRLCRSYGVRRVRRVLNTLEERHDIPAPMASDWRHRLDNIERGFRDAAHRLVAT
uniref:hypothetical protein n=1 Tax=Azospirillum argentinense TaxID=2970906 RepID=UPI0010C04716|nr:hypothetical protein [Azospirillum argentinense]